MLGVHERVEMAHVLGADFPGEISKGSPKLWKSFESGMANDGDGVIGREIVEVVVERNELQRVNETVRGIAGDYVDLMIDERAIEEAEVHDPGLRREVEGVAIGPAAKAVGTLEEFVAYADTEPRSDGSEVGHIPEVEAGGIVLADDHGERIGEAKRLGNVEVVLVGVFLFDARVDRSGSVGWRRGIVEDGRERSAGVFDVEVNISSQQGFVDQKRATEIRLAHNGNAGAGFDVLGEKFSEEDLLGEKFGADGEMGTSGMAAGRAEKRRD